MKASVQHQAVAGLSQHRGSSHRGGHQGADRNAAGIGDAEQQGELLFIQLIGHHQHGGTARARQRLPQGAQVKIGQISAIAGATAGTGQGLAIKLAPETIETGARIGTNAHRRRLAHQQFVAVDKCVAGRTRQQTAAVGDTYAGVVDLYDAWLAFRHQCRRPATGCNPGTRRWRRRRLASARSSA